MSQETREKGVTVRDAKAVADELEKMAKIPQYRNYYKKYKASYDAADEQIQALAKSKGQDRDRKVRAIEVEMRRLLKDIEQTWEKYGGKK
jgi:hypothetical protein